MKVYQCQTAKGKPNGVWHLLDEQSHRVNWCPGRKVQSVCGNGDWWIGGYHRDKPPTLPEIVEYTDAYQSSLCPACVMRAFQTGLIRIVSTEPEPIAREVEDQRRAGIPIDKVLWDD
jgi:hypothetical protein